MNHKRKLPRHRGNPHYDRRRQRQLEQDVPHLWLNGWPRWHDVIFHRRPHRRRTRAMEIMVLRGFDSDGFNWPQPKKPHTYYW